VLANWIEEFAVVTNEAAEDFFGDDLAATVLQVAGGNPLV